MFKIDRYVSSEHTTLLQYPIAVLPDTLLDSRPFARVNCAHSVVSLELSFEVKRIIINQAINSKKALSPPERVVEFVEKYRIQSWIGLYHQCRSIN
ncbi:hypothetical protein Y032_0023g763 [Ancylostoma ceylanicum]|uniref:Uncharacterized protein n=1 Tax=Ancylostoma ceylanicum TaxID=53326 RepID=A0A016UWR9_9BILA|nr:hypothetical protein Y032_0023g763 [Ancylostoma ceylanicum]